MAQAAATAKLQLKIGGMSCSFCAETIRKAYHRMEGVGHVHVSLSISARVRSDCSPRSRSKPAIRYSVRRN